MTQSSAYSLHSAYSFLAERLSTGMQLRFCSRCPHVAYMVSPRQRIENRTRYLLFVVVSIAGGILAIRGSAASAQGQIPEPCKYDPSLCGFVNPADRTSNSTPMSDAQIEREVRQLNADEARNVFGMDTNGQFEPRAEQIVKKVVALYGSTSHDELIRYFRALEPGVEQNIVIVVLLPLAFGRDIDKLDTRSDIVSLYASYSDRTTFGVDRNTFAKYQELRLNYSKKVKYLDLSRDHFTFFYQAAFSVGIQPSGDPNLERYRHLIGSLVGVPYKS